MKAAFRLSVPVLEENLVPSTIAEKLAPVEDPEDACVEDAGPGEDGSEDAVPEHPANHKEVQTMHPARIECELMGFILFFSCKK